MYYPGCFVQVKLVPVPHVEISSGRLTLAILPYGDHRPFLRGLEHFEPKETGGTSAVNCPNIL